MVALTLLRSCMIYQRMIDRQYIIIYNLHTPFHDQCNVPHAHCSHTPDRRSFASLTAQSRWKSTINYLLSCKRPPERSKETAGGCRRSPAKPSPAQPSPAQPSPPLPSPRRRQAQALARVERRRQRQEARTPGLWQNLVWSMAHERGWYGWWGGGCGGHEMRPPCWATAGPAFVGLCRTQETTSGAVPAQRYAECM